jgi:hypothetical protein
LCAWMAAPWATLRTKASLGRFIKNFGLPMIVKLKKPANPPDRSLFMAKLIHG